MDHAGRIVVGIVLLGGGPGPEHRPRPPHSAGSIPARIKPRKWPMTYWPLEPGSHTMGSGFKARMRRGGGTRRWRSGVAK